MKFYPVGEKKYWPYVFLTYSSKVVFSVTQCDYLPVIPQKQKSTESGKKIWNASRICVSSLRRGHANLLCIVPILIYVLPKQVHFTHFNTYFYTKTFQSDHLMGKLTLACNKRCTATYDRRL